MDVSGNKDNEGQQVIVHTRHNGANQRWNIVYLKDHGKDATKGYNKDFGMYINRPFYLVSRQPFRRVMECVGANNAVMKRWVKNRSSQQFFFDEKTKTVRSQQWKNYALEIQSNGGSNNARFTSGINSRWW